MCLAAMMAAGTSLKAQEVTIVLMPGWTWISIPSTDTLDFATALGSFTPEVGDLIASQWGNAVYMGNGQWRGSVSQFYPGYGYKYKSTRTVPVMLTFNVQQPNPQGGDHEYVDLGLPSGLLWATCNVGADNPEDYGDYFAWGETQPKDIYNWSTYQYCMGSYNTMTKYCNNSSYGYNGFTDNLTTLLPEDDAATANWGSDWRMPTKEEFQELYNNTTVTWIQQNGVNGRLFTATNGNSLFLPAAGYRDYSNLCYAGSYGYYWSSSLNTDNPGDAWNLYFNSGHYRMSNGSRYYGQSVRPVRSASQN